MSSERRGLAEVGAPVLKIHAAKRRRNFFSGGGAFGLAPLKFKSDFWYLLISR